MADTFALPAFHAVTITAGIGATGILTRIASGTSYAGADILESTTTVVGPFDAARNYEITTLTGTITYSIAAKEATDNSADLSAALSDETGTGAAVFGTAPTLSAPKITHPVATASANGAITITSGVVKITKAGVCALTLEAHDTDGIVIRVVSTTDHAHTITATALIDDGVTGGSKTTATFAAFAGASITLVSIGSKWSVLALNAVAVS